jgi:hypothetical protein
MFIAKRGTPSAFFQIVVILPSSEVPGLNTSLKSTPTSRKDEPGQKRGQRTESAEEDFIARCVEHALRNRTTDAYYQMGFSASDNGLRVHVHSHDGEPHNPGFRPVADKLHAHVYRSVERHASAV